VARAISDRARTYGLRTVAHIGTTRDALIAAEAGVALWVHGVYKERIPDRDIAVLANYHIPMVATIEFTSSTVRKPVRALTPPYSLNNGLPHVYATCSWW